MDLYLSGRTHSAQWVVPPRCQGALYHCLLCTCKIPPCHASPRIWLTRQFLHLHSARLDLLFPLHPTCFRHTHIPAVGTVGLNKIIFTDSLTIIAFTLMLCHQKCSIVFLALYYLLDYFCFCVTRVMNVSKSSISASQKNANFRGRCDRGQWHTFAVSAPTNSLHLHHPAWNQFKSLNSHCM